MTGTFDNWSRSAQLKKQDNIFQRQVDIPSKDSNVYYKFVVDGQWKLDHSAPSENDPSGNSNNVLRPGDITPHPSTHVQHPAPSIATAAMSGVGPNSSTAEMAGKVPLEKNKGVSTQDEGMPGAFPSETPQKEQGDFSVKPIPASSGMHNPVQLVPGEKIPDPLTHNSAIVNSRAHDDPALREGDKTFRVSPLPATAGAGNPIHVKPGEKLPASSTYTTNTAQSHVKTDQASYEKSDAYPRSNDARQDTTSSGAFGVPPVTQNMIPESSLPMGSSTSAMEKDAGPTIQSAAGENTSTAALAGQVPKESRGVPEVVRESQIDAHESPEASSSKAAVSDKSQVEQELKQKVPEQPSTSENSTMKTAAGATIAGAAGLAGGAAAYAAGVPQSIQKAISDMNTSSNSKKEAAPGETAPGETAPGVPEQASSSQVASSTSPEASANPESVASKKAMEAELESKVAKSDESGEAAPPYTESRYNIEDENTMAAISVANAGPGAQAGQEAKEAALPASSGVAAGAGAGGAIAAFKEDPVAGPGSSGSVPEPSGPSQAEAFKSDPISPGQTVGHLAPPGKGGLNAGAATPAKSAATEAKEAKKVADEGSRDISPMTKPGQPSVTTGTESGKAPTKSEGGEESPGATDKKGKRRSFFGKIKDKLKH